MREVNNFYSWFVKLGGDTTMLDVPHVIERLNSGRKKNKRKHNLKQFNYVFTERYY